MLCPLYGQQPVWEKLMSLLKSNTHGSHIFLFGAPGSGKTTLMKSFLKLYAKIHEYGNWESWGEEPNEDCMILSSDQDRGIQTIRANVSLFVRQIGPNKSIGIPRHRWVVIDDCDMLPHISQQALRRPMECYSHITRFFFIGSSLEDLIPAIQSRCIIIQLQPVNFFEHAQSILTGINMPHINDFTIDMFYTIINMSNNNFADTLRYLNLIRNYCLENNSRPTNAIIHRICSVPYYNLFVPLMNSICGLKILETNSLLVKIWKCGYTFEDIVDSLNQIYILYGDNTIQSNLIIKTFQINAWVDYCKGNTSILALQNITYRTFKELQQIIKKLEHAHLGTETGNPLNK